MCRHSCLAFALLFAGGTGCDPAKLEKLADQATKRVAKVGTDVIAKLDTHESLAGAITGNIERLADTLSVIQDETSAKAQAGQLKAQAEELRGYVDRLRKLPALRDVEMAKRIRADYGERMKGCSRRYGEEARRVNGVPEMRDAIADTMQYLKDVMWDLQFAELDAIQREAEKIAKQTMKTDGPPPPPPAVVQEQPWIIAGKSSEREAPAVPNSRLPKGPKSAEERQAWIEELREKSMAVGRAPVDMLPPLEGSDVLTIVVEGVPKENYSRVLERARAVTSSVRYQSKTQEGLVTFKVQHTEDAKLVAEKIDFGKVTKIEAATRTIHVKHQ